ncbi:hypothetical protein BDZ91DRAFT_742202 [Kalaharituber pfeilii]|nr:hypothetical protein BDZ91DRAFT_742202 [Kalaharituber pfeilii]
MRMVLEPTAVFLFSSWFGACPRLSGLSRKWVPPRVWVAGWALASCSPATAPPSARCRLG